MKIAVHITHESVQKIGGIGSVLSGVCNVEKYKSNYDQTVFYGPLFDISMKVFSDLGKSGNLLYSSHSDFDAENYSTIFSDIIKKYNIDIIYGKRELVSEFDMTKHINVDVINVGIHKMDQKAIDIFKYKLWDKYGIESDQYRNDWDYEQYIRIALPFIEILESLYGSDPSFYHFAHEYMGVPCGLSALMSGRKDKTVFIGHEVTTARSVVEGHGGHDVSFYNIMKKVETGKSLEDVFGSQMHNSRSELVKRAVNFDHIFAVGDHVKEEYQFLVPGASSKKIKVVYNGVSVKSVSIKQKKESRSRLNEYLERLFNFKPDSIFTHVTRLVISKGIWRDIQFLYHLDDIFHKKNLKGVYILLSTVIGTGRSSDDVFKMESDYGWPVSHREGWPDLIGDEIDTYRQLELFNARSKSIKGLFINQFGFDAARCGKRVPGDIEFDDIRIGSDAEFGLSIYEPFGIAQIETIPFGGIAILSSSCGACGLLKKKYKGASIKPYYIVDYISAGKRLDYENLKNLSIKDRTEMEGKLLKRHVKKVFDILPVTDKKREQYLSSAHENSDKISWDSVAKGYIL